ncbi:MAG: cation diffusion facilitator family transporter [Acidobacteria bacterium]|nr:cation diffusion facilitator family transporter [Acidobacteriota bacterium]
MATGESRRAILAALLANLGIAIAKFVGFAFTMSSSMLAEGVHSVADTGNQVLLLVGGARSKRPATPQHPFGYGRERYFWAFVVSIVLFTLGSAFAVFEGIEKIRHPHQLESPAWAIGILSVAFVLEAFSFRTAVHEARPAKGRSSWAGYVRHSKSPEIPVVLLEDTGALIGLAIALAAVITDTVTGDAVWDGIGTLSIGLLLGVIAIVLCVEMKSLLIGESATARHEDAMRAAILGDADVLDLIHLRTEHIGPEQILLAAKVQFRGDLTMADLARVVDRVETAVRAAVPEVDLIYLEPDIRRPEI